MQPFTGFVACFDARTRNPRWVVERVNRASLKAGDGVTREGEIFAEDAEIDPRFRAKLEDFRGSGCGVELSSPLRRSAAWRERAAGLSPARPSSLFSPPPPLVRARPRGLSPPLPPRYDRGHMAPAANHKGSRKELQETFCLANISPQARMMLPEGAAPHRSRRGPSREEPLRGP